jgi:hypothetical protein
MPAALVKGIDDQKSLQKPQLSNMKSRLGALQTIRESEWLRLKTRDICV